MTVGVVGDKSEWSVRLSGRVREPGQSEAVVEEGSSSNGHYPAAGSPLLRHEHIDGADLSQRTSGKANGDRH
jgi:hypothetical protein